jgi:hypothetical protein
MPKVVQIIYVTHLIEDGFDGLFVPLSHAQIHRLVTTKPVRLSIDLLAALCDIFECEPGSLIVISIADAAQRRSVGGEQLGEWTDQRPRRPPPFDLGPAGR